MYLTNLGLSSMGVSLWKAKSGETIIKAEGISVDAGLIDRR
jgi:hypothetical protein